jgi:hypothetical protein
MRLWPAWRKLAGAMWLSLLKRYARRRQAVDAAIDAYLRWREECAAVRNAYRRWTGATAASKPLAFDAYLVALAREERAASVYAGFVGRAGRLAGEVRERSLPTFIESEVSSS